MSKKVVKDCRNCKYGEYNDHWGTNFCYATKDCVGWNLWEPSDKIYEKQEPYEDCTNRQKEIKNALEQLNLGPEEDVTVEYNNAVNVAIEALELQVPDEWQTDKFDPSYFSYTEPKIVYICRNCNGIADDAYKYCPHCGKAKTKNEKPKEINKRCINCEHYITGIGCEFPCSEETKDYWQLKHTF